MEIADGSFAAISSTVVLNQSELISQPPQILGNLLMLACHALSPFARYFSSLIFRSGRSE
jgi:hypothetical protein